MGPWPPPRSLQPGWLRPLVLSQTNIPREKSGHDDSSSRAWHGRSITPGTAQSGRGSLALSVDKCLTQEETTGHRGIPDVPGSHPELFSSQKYPDLLQICTVLNSAQVVKQVRDGTNSCSTQVLPAHGPARTCLRALAVLEAHWNKMVFQGISILSQQAGGWPRLGSAKAGGGGEGTTEPAQDFPFLILLLLFIWLKADLKSSHSTA